MTRYGLIGLLLLLAVQGHVRAAVPEYIIELRDHLFFPAELTVPADTRIKLVVINHDPTPEEFESFEFNREKVIPGGSKAVIFVGPLATGSYRFFGEFNPKTAQGRLLVVTQED